MTHYAVNGAVLLLGILLAPSAGAQNITTPATQRIADVVVRPVSEVGTLERVTIALTRAFIPGAKTFAPLYAYGRELACSDSRDTNEIVMNHRGPAALVYDDKGVSRARYHKTTELAIKDAMSSGLCNDDSDTMWFFATTYPLDSDDIEEEQRYISRDVEQVDRQLGARPD
jgi:hypothetical protein